MGFQPLPHMYRTLIAGYFLMLAFAVSAQRDCVINTALSEVGVKESGYNRGKRVEEYQRAAGLKQGDKWCGAFVTWVYQQCNTPIPRGSAYSPNWFPQQRIISTHGKDKEQPLPGDVTGFWNNQFHRIAHVGLFVCRQGDFTITIEGNTGSGDENAPDGVYRRKRITRQVTYISKWLVN